MHSIQPLCRLAAISWKGVLTDVDDTLTRDGVIEQSAIHALTELRHAGIPVIAVTGRPVGWCEMRLPQLPVDGVVAENGGVCLVTSNGQPVKRYMTPPHERASQYALLQTVLERIECTVEGACRATDSAGRETDIAIDHSEHRRLNRRQIDEVVQLMRAHGLTATVSSIHINGWLGDHNKWTGAQWGTKEILGQNLMGDLDRWVYVGDSANDEIMFQHMIHSVGVANIAQHLPVLLHKPKYITNQERGEGFSELSNYLLGRHG